jgi:hypothetical protein
MTRHADTGVKRGSSLCESVHVEQDLNDLQVISKIQFTFKDKSQDALDVMGNI